MTAPTMDQTEVAEGPVVARVDWAPVPRVNLLPSEILEGRRFRVVQGGLAAVVLATLCVAAAAFWWSERGVSDARDQLETVQARTLTLQAKQRSYAEVPETLAALDYAEAARATVMTNDVAWYRYLGDLDDALPTGVSFKNITFKVPGPVAAGQAAVPVASSATADPFLPPTALGTVDIEGLSGTYPQVASWMDGMDKLDGLDVSTLENAIRQVQSNVVSTTFSGGITLTTEALSHRYDRKAS